MGKSSINEPFSMAMLNNQRVRFQGECLQPRSRPGFVPVLLAAYDSRCRQAPFWCWFLWLLKGEHMSYGQYSWLITINRG